MSSLHYFANRYRNRVSRKREFFNLYKTVFVILNMQKSHKISLFKIWQLFYHVASQTSSIFTCNTCTKSRGLFSGYFSAAYAFRTLILLTFGRSFQRVPWQMNSIFIIVLVLLVLTGNALFCKGFWDLCSLLWNYGLWQIIAELGKLLLPVSSKIGSKTKRRGLLTQLENEIAYVISYNT